ncbi:hypothetical protein Micbo1qcDRAFT_215402 [Microdochium bolleyi]|uniref:F-box domain-containing protein n=1 Tax=Microdochium bolleyi TaxID=196109 RepID=A0A136IT32_9PEZI|nr:hypothetical protein Micbo1qcDRAFT_215402 [Microdochium bolleyi]
MPILSLPTEILQQVLDLTAGDDYEHLMLTCSRVFRCGQDRLHQHNARRRRWRYIRIRSWENDADGTVARSMADWLLGLAAYPEIAQYARVLSIMSDHDLNAEEEQKKKEEEEEDDDAIAASPAWCRGAVSRAFDSGLVWLRAEEHTSIDQGNASGWATAGGALQVVMESPWLEAAGANQLSWLARVPRFRELVGEDNFPAGGERTGLLRSQTPSSHGGPIRLRGQPHADERESLATSLFVLLLSRLDRLERFDCRVRIHWRGRRGNFDPSIEGVLQLMSVRAGGSPGTAKRTCGASEGNVPLAQGSRRHMLDNSPLSSLRDVSHTGSRIGSNVDLAQWGPFLTLPCLRVFSAANVVSIANIAAAGGSDGKDSRYYQNGSYRWPSKEPNPGNDTVSPLLACSTASGIEKLDLRACVMDTASMASLVSHMPRLKELRYSHREQGSLAYVWDVAQFLDAIAAAAGVASQDTIAGQLTSLDIGIHAQDRGTRNTRVKLSTGAAESLRKFTALKQLEIDVELLLGSRTRSGTQGDPFDVYDQVPSLIDMLPETETLEELVLSIGPYTGPTAWLPLLNGFARGRRRKLPRLSWITIKDNSIREEWLRQMEWPWAGSSGGDAAVEEQRQVVTAAQEIEAEYVVDGRA